MARPKNPKPAATPGADALLGALSEASPSATATLPAPRAEDNPKSLAASANEIAAAREALANEIAAAGDQAATTSALIKALIEALGHQLDDVASLEIRRAGRVRVLGRDRALRTHRFDWPSAEDAA